MTAKNLEHLHLICPNGDTFIIEVQKKTKVDVNITKENDLSEIHESNEAFSWTSDKTKLLITLRADMDADFQKPKTKKNKLWDKIAEEFKEVCGQVVSGEACNKKWRNLIVTYRRIMDHNKRNGHVTSSWEFFNDIDAVLGEKVGSNPLSELVRSSFRPSPSVSPSTSDISSIPSSTSSFNDTDSFIDLPNEEMNILKVTSQKLRNKRKRKEKEEKEPPSWFQSYLAERREEMKRLIDIEQQRLETDKQHTQILSELASLIKSQQKESPQKKE